jgi:hypothetical protein
VIFTFTVWHTVFGQIQKDDNIFSSVLFQTSNSRSNALTTGTAGSDDTGAKAPETARYHHGEEMGHV